MLSQTMSKQRPRDHQTTTCRLVNSNILETPKDKTITSATYFIVDHYDQWKFDTKTVLRSAEP
jgi:hypothetical protein